MGKPPRARMLMVMAAVLVAWGSAAAQDKPSANGEEEAPTKIGSWYLEGLVEAGVRFFAQDPRPNAKFEEYQDINQGLFLEGLRLRLHSPDEKYSIELRGRDWGLATQEYGVMGERLGLWQAGFEWDQMRHVYATNAQTFYTVFGDNVFILPNPRPPLSSWNGSPSWGHSEASRGTNTSGDGQIAQQWNTARMFFKLSPTPNLDISAEYQRIHKDGQRPFGMAFGSPGGAFVELVQPIDQTIHEFRLRGTYATEMFQLMWGYTASVFVNAFTWMRADNPCNPSPGAPCPGVGNTAQFGTTSLPPDNQAHTFNLAAGINLPMRTRVNGNITYSLRLQNQDFQQQTYSNSLPSTNPDLQLPEKSLHGVVHTFLGNLDVTSRPFAMPLTLGLKYRIYDLQDDSHTPTFQAFIINDQNAVLAAPRRAGRFDYTRQTGEVYGRYTVTPGTAVTVGIGWEGYDRNDNWEVTHSDEAFAKVALDTAPYDWLLLRLKYQPSFRRGNGYNANASLKENFGAPPGFAGTGSQTYQLRKFNQADRNEHRVDLMVDLTPVEELTFTPTAGYRFDNYIASGLKHNGNTPNEQQLGLQNAVSWTAGLDVNWIPSDRIAFSVGYVHESIFQKQRQTFRNPLDPTLDWISNTTDTIDTFHAAVKTSLIPRKLDLIFSGSYSYALGQVEQYSPNATGSTVYTANPNAQTMPFPSFEDSFARVDLSLEWHVTKAWTARFFYAFERFTQSNWQTDQLRPSLENVGAIFLGADAKNYAAHILGATLRYTFP
jgi:MtrB/PioB family decaheme-associated outer membrane protein